MLVILEAPPVRCATHDLRLGGARRGAPRAVQTREGLRIEYCKFQLTRTYIHTLDIYTYTEQERERERGGPPKPT